MTKLLPISLILGISFTVPSALANPFPAEANQEVNQAAPQTDSEIQQLLQSWGLELTECKANTIQIKHDKTGEVACAVPSQKLQSGNYIYNSAEHTLSPVKPPAEDQATKTPAPQVQPEPKSEPVDPQIQARKLEEFTFDFNNTYDYATCLDIILLSYEGRNSELKNAAQNDCGTKVLTNFGNNLTKEIAVKLVEKADLHATEGLQSPLLPSLGLRRRIAINLGYVYDIDKNNPNILKYTNPE